MILTLFDESKLSPPIEGLDDLFQKLMAGEGATDWKSQVNLILISDQRMEELNLKYREQDRTTDVLSFNIDEPSEPESVLGEIYISVPVATKQAVEFGVSLADEIKRLFTHGLLHLLGYDHQEKSEAEKMYTAEEKYLGLVREKD